MIVRIMGEGQFRLADDAVVGVNQHDALVESALRSGDETAFRAALSALLEGVRSSGSPIPDDELVESEVILPPADATIEQVEAMLAADGLIPG